MHKFLSVCTLTLALAACAQTPAPVASSPAPADQPGAAHCDASKVVEAIGQLPTPAIQERARSAAGAKVVRVLRHDQVVTMEFREGRLNLVLDAAGRISSANCS
ncbi:MAG: I78 family peptidase inhibitor [Pseudoxanthomonas sp.]